MDLFELDFSLGICPWVRLRDHMITLFLVFYRTSIPKHNFYMCWETRKFVWLNLLQWSGTKYTISPSYACTLFCTNSWKSGIPIVHLNGNNPHFKCSLSICGWELPCWTVWSGFSITSTRLEQKFKLVFAACPAPSPQQRKPKNTQKNNLWLIKDARQIMSG